MSQKKLKSMSDKLLDLINPAPVHFDPEADIHTETAAKLVDNDYSDQEPSVNEDEEALSQFRKQNAQLIEETDKRYTGKKVSRTSLVSSDKELSDNGDGEDNESRVDADSTDDDGSDDEGSEFDSGDGEDLSGVEVNDDDDDNDDGNDEEEDYSINQSLTAEEETPFKHISSRGDDTQVDKGSAIHRQLSMWDNLLECRIQLQKCLAAANKLPQPEALAEFRSQGGSKFNSAADQMKKSVANLLEKLIELRTERLKLFGETKNIAQTRRPGAKAKKQDSSDEEITSSSDDHSEEEEEEENEKEIEYKSKKRKLDDYSQLLETQHKDFVEYRNATIQKWNDKTRVAFGNVNSRNFSAFEQSTLRQIEQIMSNRQRLIGRTQEKRTLYKVLGKASVTATAVTTAPTETMEDTSKEFDVEIFDDSDFYHQLLRELIERKATDVTDPVQLGRQWLELQKARSKMKRKVDMRATKGRKIRYTVHPKLVNFMAPVVESQPWNEDAKGELYNSLFGKSS